MKRQTSSTDGNPTMRVTTAAAALLITFACSSAALAQVQVQRDGKVVTIVNGQGAARTVVTKGSNGLSVTDSDGSRYQACWCPSGTTKPSGSATCVPYSSADRVSPSIVAGYADALKHMVDNYGAIVEHDAILNVDYVSFPGTSDPYEILVQILLNDYVNGRPILDYFKTIEPTSFGATGDTYESVNPKGKTTAFPNDPYFGSQWNLQSINLDRALKHSFSSALTRPVKIGVIDSGINAADLSHPGLDGVAFHNRTPELSTGFGVSHGLSVTTLLGDAGNDADGPVGLIGSWSATTASVFSRHPAEIYLYNAGDFLPMSTLVAKGIALAIADGVDIINLNLRAAYSYVIEEQIQRALDSGIIIVAAAGNFSPNDPAKNTGFPGRLDGVISVASSNRGGALSSFSANTGFDVVAPGEDIVVGSTGGTWSYGDGTSFAAPHVVAAAALMKMAKPDLTSPEAERILVETADVKKGKGHALVDALAALNRALGAGQYAAKNGTAVEEVPTVLSLSNYPNPFNPSTTITLEVAGAGVATIEVFDVLGRRIMNLREFFDAGTHEIKFSGESLPGGMYFYQVKLAEQQVTRSMTLLK